ncbi:MAG: hypothetical protein DBY32_02825 [Phascolarctobacterium sp.]|nr:MAG: hypothetical protein DBY32_06050 [Phascolarctobacterium sp.]PWM78522.1 MAG: hypothetical protein DBY32_03280 [Phascolarctobacterium sp.]PWM78981.1 MAG: hypothetical protein DBY32_05810 [Phascolarctobacterium sp.]PWM79437.1 MAG: hypothetical protein DBY32_00790 [Phascolarctobacterium sp.]PWM79806.1 MAG: hypothetical protein DBY32_02825 [Phascolarctobacterium sp.]
MNKNLIFRNISNKSTKAFRGGTAQDQEQFELNLQLHAGVSNPYTFKITKNYKASADTKAAIPPYTEKSWTTPGTYTWSVPNGVSKIKVEIAGAGGGGDIRYYDAGSESMKYGANGGSGALIIQTVTIKNYLLTASIIVGCGGRGYNNGNTTITDGENSAFKIKEEGIDITAMGGKRGKEGSVGTSYGNGGSGGSGGYRSSENGNNGWVKIAYGEGIE